jgi:putative flippase GtrA
MKSIYQILSLTVAISLASINFVQAQKKEVTSADAQAIADKLSNPVSNLISVPFQSNVDYGIGPYHGSKYTLNFQPVIPIQLNKNLNLITRYIIPIVDQHDISKDGGNEFGLSDATITGFFAPAKANGGLIWGLGPAFLVPIATNDFLGTKKWGVGPSALVLKQSTGLIFGFLVNQIWSFAGDKNRSDVNQMFLQPFFTHNWKSGAGIGINAEITANWQAHTTTAFINPIITGVTKLGKQTVSLGVGPRIPVASPVENRADFGLRAVLTFVFPK